MLEDEDSGRQQRGPMNAYAKWILDAAAVVSLFVGAAGLAGIIGGTGPIPGWAGFLLIILALVMASYANILLVNEWKQSRT